MNEKKKKIINTKKYKKKKEEEERSWRLLQFSNRWQDAFGIRKSDNCDPKSHQDDRQASECAIESEDYQRLIIA